MRVSLAVVAAVVALGLAPGGASARLAPPSIDLTSVTFTPDPNVPNFCAPIWHFTAQGVTGNRHAPWRAAGTLNPPVISGITGFTFSDPLTRANNGKSLAITDDLTGADAIPLETSVGTSRDYQLTLFNASSTMEATSQTVSATDPTTSSC
jgi:hypothetical protein